MEQEYINHEVFDKIILYKNFYEKLSESVHRYLDPLQIVEKGILRFHNTLFRSIKTTLESIELLLKAKHINDAIALVRKYYDASLINIYLYLVLNEDPKIKDNISEWFDCKKKMPEYRIISNYVKNHTVTKAIFEILEKKLVIKK